MNYKLSFENETYPVEDLHLPAEATLAREPDGKPFSFVAPVRMRAGQSCALRSDSGNYQLLVNACLGFTYTPRYLISGIIATKEVAAQAA